ncbi:MAG TPA: biotin/lipoyl-containing protein, partial [Parafilimonas sp.]|nr:biotin/lipoyl-containing protein [Parafilimonas sp.]
MAEKILMPRLSDTMTEGVIAAWHKNVGDPVKKGDLLAEIETDKATMELESYKDGVLLHRGAEEGGKLQVNDLLAIVGDKGEDVSGLIGSNGAAKKEDTSTKKSEKENPKSEKQLTQDKKTEEKKQETGNSKLETKRPETSNQKPSTENVDISKMEEVVLMPRLSDTMTEGVIASWQKNVGDDVNKGDILAEIETDKATMELESYKDGKLLYQGAKQGEKIAVNDLLAIIGKEGFDVNKVVAAAKGGGQQQEPVAKDNADQQKAEGDVSKTASSGVPQQKVEDTAHEPEQQVVNEGRIFASPLAKRLAEEKGIDLKYVKGTGDNGRITKSDIDNYQPVRSEKAEVRQEQRQEAPSTQPAQKQQPIVATPTYTKEDFEEVPVSQMRKTIARRLAESKFSAPHFYLTMSIDMDACVAARAKLNEVSPVKISFNDIVL